MSKREGEREREQERGMHSCEIGTLDMKMNIKNRIHDNRTIFTNKCIDK